MHPLLWELLAPDLANVPGLLNQQGVYTTWSGVTCRRTHGEYHCSGPPS